jgi:hypothetical protein
MEWWSNDVLLWILGDTRNPIFVVALVFQFLDQTEQSVFNFIV